MSQESRKKDIAIVGMSCKFNRSENAIEFWDNLTAGNELLNHYTTEELLDLGLSPAIVNRPDFIKMNSTIADAGSFDYPFFGYTRDEANIMDPQIRLLHEQVWSALEDAAYDVTSSQHKVGLFLAATDHLNWIAHALLNQNKKVAPFYLAKISNKNFISTLISYSLNLTGPSYYIDTACSSSLAAVHLACRNLLLRECSIAVAGGIKLDTTKNYGYVYQEGMIFSKDGHCRAFDEAGSGTVGGNGVGVVVLKRFEDAVRDKDNIYAVIRASVVNNDGKQKVGYTAPSVKGQTECIEQAHKFANIDPGTISYIEAHGTATHLGDPVEVEALNAAFNYNTNHRCAIGSVKTNIGHLDTAAGVAGLIKTSLALYHKMIPPSLNFTKPNPKINFKEGPFYVNTKLATWKRTDGNPLRAGLSSFGIGGSNAHVVLEEGPEIIKSDLAGSYTLIPLSAKTPTALSGYARGLSQFLKNNTAINLGDLSFTLGTGRAAFNYRNFLVCSDRADAIRQLEGLSSATHHAVQSDAHKNVVFMFPGQGSQYFRMAADLYRENPEFKNVMDRGFQLLDEETGSDFKKIVGFSDDETNHTLINETNYTQPLLFLIQYGLASLLLKWDIRPDYMIGHSLGEYVAACIAEVFSLEEGLKLLLKRSALMSKVERGSMLAVAAPIEQVRPLLNETIAIAAINTDNTCVVSGPIATIDEFTALLAEQEIAYTKLKTSHAFHSSMMDAILDDYKKALQKVNFSTPKLAYISNLTGKKILDKEAVDIEYWVRHLRETVQFGAGINYLLEKGNYLLIEVGSGRALTSFCKQSTYYSDKNTAVQLLRHAKETHHDVQFLANALGKLWKAGLTINWTKYHQNEIRNKLTAPSYFFDKYDLDFQVNPMEQVAAIGTESKNSRKPLSEWFYTQNWKRSFRSAETSLSELNHNFLIFTDGAPLLTALADQLSVEGNVVCCVNRGNYYQQYNDVTFTIDPEDESDYVRLFEDLNNSGVRFDQVIFNWSFDKADQEGLSIAFKTQLNICKQLVRYQQNYKKKITVIHDFNQHVLGTEESNITLLATSVINQVLAQENINIMSCFIDVDVKDDDQKLVFEIISELKYNKKDINVAYRNNERWIEFYEQVTLEHTADRIPVSADKVYLITGGTGHIGNILATYLCDQHKAKVIVLGKSIIPAQQDWNAYLSVVDVDTNMAMKIKEMQEHHSLGREIHYYQTDVADFTVLQHTLYEIEARHGKISGVIHAAGNNHHSTFKSIEHLNEDVIKQQFDPKVNGTLNLYKLFKNRSLDFVWITSSLSSILGGLTYGAYAAANKFIDAFVLHNKKERANWFCVNLDGVGEGLINAAELVKIFEHSLGAGVYRQSVISVSDLKSRMIHSPLKAQVETTSTIAILQRPLLDVDYVAPVTETEKLIGDLFKSFFGYEDIGVDDDFFELGGDSLKAMILIKEIHKIFEVEINLKEFFLKLNIRALSEEIDLAKKLSTIQKTSNSSHVIKI